MTDELPPLGEDADDAPEPADITGEDMAIMDRLTVIRLMVAGHMYQMVETVGFDGDGAVEAASRLHGHPIDKLFARIPALPPVPTPDT